MRTYTLPLVAGLVLGGLVHIVTTLTMQRVASEDAFARLARLGPPNVVQLIPEPTPTQTVLPRMDPAFLSAVCVYDPASAARVMRGWTCSAKMSDSKPARRRWRWMASASLLMASP